MSAEARNILASLVGDKTADDVIASLQQRDVFLMHWPAQRTPNRTEFRSHTMAGPVKLEAHDLMNGKGGGVRMTISYELSQQAMILNVPYPDLGMLGSWMVARAIRSGHAEPEPAKESA